MLILSRDIQEKIIIHDEIKIIVLNILNTTVKLGIEAPYWISIHREEVYRRIKASHL